MKNSRTVVLAADEVPDLFDAVMREWAFAPYLRGDIRPPTSVELSAFAASWPRRRSLAEAS